MPLYIPNAADALFSGYNGTTIYDQGPAGGNTGVFAQTFYKPIQDEVLNLIQVIINGGLGLKVINNTGVTLPAGPIAISGYNSGSSAWKAIKADATGPTPVPAILILLTSLTNGSTRTVFAQGTVLGADSSFSTLGSSAGDPVYLAVGGGFTLTEPTSSNLVQPVGAVLTVANPGNVLALIKPIQVPVIGYSGFSGYSGFGQSGYSGFSGYSGSSGVIGTSGFSGADSGYSGYSGPTGTSGFSGFSGTSGFSGLGFSGEGGTSGYSGFSGASGSNATGLDTVSQGFMERTHYIFQTSGFSSTASTPAKLIDVGHGSTFSSFGTNIHSFPDFGNGVMFSAAATSGSAGGVINGTVVGGFVVCPSWHIIQSASIWTGNSSNDIASVRLYVGLYKAGATVPDTTDTVATLQAIPMLAFRYDSTGGVDTVGQWSAVTCDGSTLNVIPAVGPIAIDTSYNLRIDTKTTPGTALFYINDVQVASTSNNLPTGTTQLQPICRLTATSTTQGAVALKKFHVSVD